MKNLVEYINESKGYILDDSERDALAAVAGVLCGAIGDEEMEKKYAPLMKELSKEEIKQLDALYDFLDDRETYRHAKVSMMKDEIPVIIKVIRWTDDNDAWCDGNDYELINILDELKH